MIILKWLLVCSNCHTENININVNNNINIRNDPPLSLSFTSQLVSFCSRTIAFYFRLVASHEQEIASSMLAAFLGIGIACGSLINLPLIQAL